MANERISDGIVSRELSLDPYRPMKSSNGAVTASATLAAASGEALDDNVVAITVSNTHTTETLYVQFDGSAADVTAFPLPAGSGTTIPGDSESLADVRLYAGSSITVGFIPYRLY